MNQVCADTAAPPDAGTRGFIAAVWPPSLPGDSDLLRRKKILVRNAQLAVAIMVAAGVAGALIADSARWSATHIAALIVTALAYIGWSFLGLREPIRRLLSEQSTSSLTPQFNGRTCIYFAVQLALAALVFGLSDDVRGGALAWLVLLPPVAHSVILLPRAGILLVSILSMAILAAIVATRQGWPFVVNASIAFSFAVFFTLIFTLLAVSAERSRAQAQRLANELAAANQKLREYAVAAEELAATRERNRLAREIHDSLGHYLTVVNVQIEAARAVQSLDPARSRDALEKAQSLTQEGLREIRRSVAALRASPLENKPMTAALEEMVAESRAAGVNVSLHVKGQPRALSPAAELTLYRTAQEGLTNIRKHAACSQASVTLDFNQSSRVLLTVSDDGAGASDEATNGRGFGLLGLRERAQLLGGALRTQTAKGSGFTLELEVPE